MIAHLCKYSKIYSSVPFADINFMTCKSCTNRAITFLKKKEKYPRRCISDYLFKRNTGRIRVVYGWTVALERGIGTASWETEGSHTVLNVYLYSFQFLNYSDGSYTQKVNK